MQKHDNDIAACAEAFPAPERDGRRLPAHVFFPFLGGATILAMAYGASFLLSDALRTADLQPALAGGMIGVGTLSTLLGSLVAGRAAQRVGLMPLVIAAAAIMAAALASFASVAALGRGAGYAGGVLLGLGWAVAYILMPVQVIQSCGASARLEALLLLSGAQMLGIGLSAPIGRILTASLGGIGRVFALDALLCGVAVALLAAAARGFRGVRQRPIRTAALDGPTVLAIARGTTAAPVVMIGLAACSFSGLSTFQSLLASAHGVPPEAFFLTFTATTVTLRFAAASRIGRLPLPRIALALALAMLAGLAGMAASGEHPFAWVAATFVFSIGYGLNYSTLNALVVAFAEERSIAVSAASQVFTVGYFIGLFGFPPVAERVIGSAGAAMIIPILMLIALANAGIAFTLILRIPVAERDGAPP